MNTDREIMQQALEALRFALHVGFDESSESQIKKGDKAVRQHENVIAALRERLAQPEQDPICHLFGTLPVYDRPRAQPEQEPVAWATRMGEYAHIHWGAKRPEYPMVYEVPLYTTPPQRKPLTDEEILECWKQAYEPGRREHDNAARMARAIEAKLREKNA